MESTCMPINRRMDEEDVITHTHTDTHTQEYYSAIKKNEMFLFMTSWMDLKSNFAK